jgi:hypothetical protein
VDTPLFQHAAHYTGQKLHALSPLHSPEEVAAAIVKCARSPRREVVVGASGRLLALLQLLAPAMMERIKPRMVSHEHPGRTDRAESTGNFERPLPSHADFGGWKPRGPATLN